MDNNELNNENETYSLTADQFHKIRLSCFHYGKCCIYLQTHTFTHARAIQLNKKENYINEYNDEKNEKNDEKVNNSTEKDDNISDELPEKMCAHIRMT